MEYEILAPAGNLLCAEAAINSGANAIYLGLSAFSARANAENFDETALSELIKRAHFLDVKIYVAMNTIVKESEREEFLSLFEQVRERSMAAFCVMGGIFSEGIDLTNDRLIGTVVVGTGLPQVCVERDIIMNYFKDRGLDGFDYAYRYPGMNKVQQAAGRVIRTHEDTGIIGLLDDRFMSRDYTRLFPREWNDIKSVNMAKVSDVINEFWKRISER